MIWLHLTLIFTGQLPAGLPLLTTALVGLILGVVVWTVRSEQGDGRPLGEGLKVTFCHSRNTREKPVCSGLGKLDTREKPEHSALIPLSKLIPLSTLTGVPLSTLIPPPLSSLIPDKNKLITINLIRMIFILLWFCAGRKDLLPGVYRRHSRGNVLVRRLVASRTPTFRSRRSDQRICL